MLGFYLVGTGSGDVAACSRCAAKAGSSDIDTAAVLASLNATVERSGDSGPSDILFAGGEPLGRSDIVELLRAARSLGIRGMAALTSGSPLAEQERAAVLVKEGLRHIHVVLLGPDAHTHDTLAGEAGFDAALGGIREFRAAAKQLGVRTMLCGRVPACPHNLEHLPAMVSMFAENGAEAVAITVTQTVDPRQAAPWIDASFDTGLVNAVWVSVEGVPGTLLRNEVAATWRPVHLLDGGS